MISKIIDIINKGEGIKVEFKECKNKINKDVFDTVCSFLNRNGGEIFLGVKDDGEILGVEPDSISQIKKDFVTVMNNGNKINPTYYLNVEEIIIENKTILYIFVPESSQVHRCNSKIFDRNEDGDINITDNTNQVAALYHRKQTTYIENTVYPYVKLNDLREDLIKRGRKIASIRVADHPWKSMSDIELLKSAGLYIHDYKENVEGFTLAAILLLGRDEVINSVIPYFKTDAILRKINLDRYDDRDDIRTNLIESYERLLAFVNKHLLDTFYLERDVRISIRDKIFREVISNILIHRDYGNPYPAKLVIGKESIYTENGNKSHGHGIIDPNNFSPFPKNPTIAKFFKELGLVDELGSGVRNIHKYGKTYFGYEPQIIEEDIFKIIFITNTTEVTTEVTTEDKLKEQRIGSLIIYCQEPRTSQEIMNYLKLKNKEHFRKTILKPLIEGGFIMLTIPDKPRSPKQRYYSSVGDSHNI